eukprot:CAMPEP_0194508112 /NCGR_PEP_ID=MMETSP0253-20130528/38026_1 /TAXON_ID=2966 /ORGANISM="Noctiluca scintillans" /LENGTH=70 /DNA_ID=CAMNT_0039351099 /DNA_START=177 /DNA_END=386 /DNA_ORIENTATION=+
MTHDQDVGETSTGQVIERNGQSVEFPMFLQNLVRCQPVAFQSLAEILSGNEIEGETARARLVIGQCAAHP